MKNVTLWPDHCRDTSNPNYFSVPGEDFGRFVIPSRDPRRRILLVIVSAGFNTIRWEHVSVSAFVQPSKAKPPIQVIPTWDEMCQVKDLFWGDEEVVVQFHPKKTHYVNYNPNVLHLWRHMDRPIETPDPILVGPTGPASKDS